LKPARTILLLAAGTDRASAGAIRPASAAIVRSIDERDKEEKDIEQ